MRWQRSHSKCSTSVPVAAAAAASSSSERQFFWWWNNVASYMYNREHLSQLNRLLPAAVPTTSWASSAPPTIVSDFGRWSVSKCEFNLSAFINVLSQIKHWTHSYSLWSCSMWLRSNWSLEKSWSHLAQVNFPAASECCICLRLYIRVPATGVNGFWGFPACTLRSCFRNKRWSAKDFGQCWHWTIESDVRRCVSAWLLSEPLRRNK